MKNLMMIAIMGTMFAGFGALADGFGSDNIFGAAISPTTFISDKACPEINVPAGEYLTIVPNDNLFGFVVFNSHPTSTVISVKIPAEGNYVFHGTAPSRIANVLVSPAQDLKISMDPVSTNVTVVSKYSTSPQSCLLRRCPAYGACE
jgi:hypothetical protein